jgi:hypothetical protein
MSTTTPLQMIRRECALTQMVMIRFIFHPSCFGQRRRLAKVKVSSCCTIEFIVLSCISQPLFDYNPTASHREYFMMKVSIIPAPNDPKNRSKCTGGLRFFFLLRVIMDVMLIGTTTLADCANHAERWYLFYAFKCGLTFGEFRKLMQHQQATRYSNYSNAIIWQQCKNARYTLHNEVLPHYNQVGLGVSWREQLKQVLSGLWK